MRKIIFTFLFYTSFASVQAQEWETVAALPSNVNVSQIKVVSEDNIIVSCNQFGLLQWNGESWNDIGEFNSLYTPYFQYFSDNDIYATKNDFLNGDTQSNYNYIAHWNGTEWTNAHNLNVAKVIGKFEVLNENEIYAVGEFVLPGYNWKPVAKYSNGSWSIVGAGDSNAGAYSTYSNLWVNNANDIYTTSGYSDSGVIRIKHWDGENWTVLYNNLEDEAERLSQSIAGPNGNLYAYGVKKGSYTSCLAQWNGEYWETLGDIEADLNIHNFSLNGGIHYKYISENEIYAVGSKFRKSDTSIYMVVKWDGENWSEVGEINANKVVESLDVHNGFLYVSGSLTNSTNQTLVKRFFVGHSTQNFNILATADPEDGGTITGSGVYTEGEEVTLTANANEGFVFVNWTKDGQEVSTFSEFSFEVLESSNFIAHFVIHELGINELNPATTNIFPNPFSNYLNIKTKNQSFQKIEILDSSGSLIFSRQLNPNSTKHSFNLEHLSSGLYFLRISNDSEKKVFKVIKK